MSIILNIVQQDNELNSVESFTVSASKITELRFVHPVKPEQEQEHYQEDPTEVEILYDNGERINIMTTRHTLFRILNKYEVVIHTNDAKIFEMAYIDTLRTIVWKQRQIDGFLLGKNL